MRVLTKLTCALGFIVFVVGCSNPIGSAVQGEKILESTGGVPIDITAPLVSDLLPSGVLPANLTQTSLQVRTNEESVCKAFSNLAASFTDAGINFIPGQNNLYTADVIISAGSNYAFKVLCKDIAGNVSADANINFSVQTPSALTLTGLSPSGTLAFGTSSSPIRVTTNRAANCRVANATNIAFANKTSMTEVAGSNNLQHEAIVNGLASGQTYTYYAQCQDRVFTNLFSSDTAITFSVAADTTLPTLSNLLPSGVLANTTTSVQLSVTASKAAVCRHSPTAGTPYANMTGVFSTVNNLVHTSQQTVSAGNSYRFYVRCQDGANNTSTESQIAFSVAAPDPLTLSGLAPTGTLPVGTTTAKLLATANRPASCRYATASGVNFATKLAMTNVIGSNGMSYEVNLSNLTSGPKSYWVQCQDSVAQTIYSVDAPISFSIAADTTPPQILTSSPSGALANTVTTANLSVTTNEASSCRYSLNPGIAYASIPAINGMTASTDGLSHTKPIPVVAGASYSYYVRCADALGNAMSADRVVSFSVNSTAVSPIEGFRNSVYVITRRDCVGCHSTSTTLPNHASADINIAYAAAKARVNFFNVPASILVSKVKDAHCGAKCTTDGSEMLAAINQWKLTENVGEPPVTATATGLIRLMPRQYVAGLLNNIFGSSANAITDGMIANSISNFGGPCEPYATNCRLRMPANQLQPGGYTQAPMIPGPNAIRVAVLYRACDRITQIDAAIENARARTGATSSGVIPTNAQIVAAYQLFYVDRTPTSDVTTALAGVISETQTKAYPSIEAWRFLFVTLCQAQDWQIP